MRQVSSSPFLPPDAVQCSMRGDVVDVRRVFLLLLQHQLIRLLRSLTHSHPQHTYTECSRHAVDSHSHTAAPSLDELSRAASFERTLKQEQHLLTAARYRKAGDSSGEPKEPKEPSPTSLTCMYMKQNPLSASQSAVRSSATSAVCLLSLPAMKTGSILNNGQRGDSCTQLFPLLVLYASPDYFICCLLLPNVFFSPFLLLLLLCSAGQLFWALHALLHDLVRSAAVFPPHRRQGKRHRTGCHFECFGLKSRANSHQIRNDFLSSVLWLLTAQVECPNKQRPFTFACNPRPRPS